jgi:signal transduction histidine kinase
MRTDELGGPIVAVAGDCERMLGVQPREVIGRTLEEVLSTVADMDEDVVQIELEHGGVSWARGEGPEAREFRATWLANGLGAYGVVTETTAMRRDERELEWALELVQRLQASVLTEGATRPLAHDMNNVLTALVLESTSALAAAEANSPASAVLRRFCDSARRAAHLAQEMMDLGSAETNGDESVPLDQAVSGMLRTLSSIAGKSVKVRLVLSANGSRAPMSRIVLERILINLVANARDAIIGTGQIVIGSVETEDGVLLTVDDNGHGMPSDVAARAFEVMFSTKMTGHGLGLSLIERNVRAAGGVVWIESNVGDGTRVSIKLPLASESS